MREAFQVCAKSGGIRCRVSPSGARWGMGGAVATDFVKYTSGVSVVENNANRMQRAWLDSVHMHAASRLYY